MSRLPEPNLISVASVVLVFFTIGTLVSYLPDRAPLVATLTLLGLAIAALVLAVLRLVTGRTYPWQSFFVVARPAFFAVSAAAGFIEFAFIHDHMRGSSLAIATTGLALLVLNLPLLLGYSVARHEPEPVAGAYS
jgi:hypothetical protein